MRATVRARAASRASCTWPRRPGVRYSLEQPHAYVRSNVTGTLNVLEGCRHNGVEHLVYASTSSVYGANTNMPFSVHNIADHPLSLYAATKRANELMAHNYSSLFELPTTGLRFFTVYGPWGRPDMALFMFTRNILEGKPDRRLQQRPPPARFHLRGRHRRGRGARDASASPQPDPAWDSDAPDPATSIAPFRLYNIGNDQPGAADALHRGHRGVPRRARRRRTSCRCSSATCRIPPPTSRISVRDVGYRPATPRRGRRAQLRRLVLRLLRLQALNRNSRHGYLG